MNLNNYTQKSLEAVQSAQQLAVANNHQQLEQVHLLLALLQQDGGLVPQLLRKMDMPPESLAAAAAAELRRIPSVRGSREADRFYITADTDAALTAAQDQAAAMKDEFVSVEHILLALIEKPNSALKRLFETHHITREAVLQKLQKMRGNTRVTSDNPEETYDALKKYGSDLTERARQQKLDPVIGRDSEIRDVVRILSRKSKNNPVLIGEPGVGKTAIAEGLAHRLVRRYVRSTLGDRQLFALVMVARVAGA